MDEQEQKQKRKKLENRQAKIKQAYGKIDCGQIPNSSPCS